MRWRVRMKKLVRTASVRLHLEAVGERYEIRDVQLRKPVVWPNVVVEAHVALDAYRAAVGELAGLVGREPATVHFSDVIVERADG